MRHKMHRIVCAIISLVLAGAGPLTSFAQRSAAVSVTSLRGEYLSDPLSIDTPEPRLSWQITSNTRGAIQTAYQVIVATSAANLTANKGDLWDTGKVPSNQTIQIVYQGKPLESRRRVFLEGPSLGPERPGFQLEQAGAMGDGFAEPYGLVGEVDRGQASFG